MMTKLEKTNRRIIRSCIKVAGKEEAIKMIRGALERSLEKFKKNPRNKKNRELKEMYEDINKSMEKLLSETK